MNKCFLKIDIASTPEKLQRGLMFVKKMPEDKGMLFKFPSSQRLRFWGYNTFIPLDIAFIDKDLVIKKIKKIKELSEKIVDSEDDCLYAIEANDGFFSKNRVAEGDSISIEKDKDDDVVYFRGKQE